MSEDPDVLRLPRNFIGKEDQAKLESFAAHLIAHGAATRWHWNKTNGVDTELLLYAGGTGGETLLARLARDSGNDSFYAEDGSGRRIASGKLEAVMTTVDGFARKGRSAPPA